LTKNFFSSRGFTLLETLIALAIMAGGLTLLVTSWSGSFMRLKKTQSAFEMAMLLEQKMGEIEFEYRGKSLDSIPDDDTGEFEEGYPDYTWELKSKKLEFPDLSTLMTSESGGADQMTLTVMKQLVETINKSVKEVTVTLIYKKNPKKPIKHSVTTYFVDYDQVNLSAQGGAPSL